MLYPVSEADLQPVELWFDSKWKGLISFCCNRTHLLPYPSICKKCIHLASTFSHTWWKENPQEIILWEFLYAVQHLRCSIRQRARTIAEILPFKHVDGCCTAPQSQCGNSSTSEVALSGGHESGAPDMAVFPCCVLYTSATLKEKLALYYRQLYIFKKFYFFFLHFLCKWDFKFSVTKEGWEIQWTSYQAFWNSTV